MVTLDALRAARGDLLKVELAGLLHNLGKLHGDFLIKVLPQLKTTHPGFRYNYQRIDDAPSVIHLRQAESIIKSNDTSPVKVQALLTEPTFWPGHEAVAQELYDRASSTRLRPGKIKADLNAAALLTGDAEAALRIAAEVVSALGLSIQLNEEGLERHLNTDFKNWLRSLFIEILGERYSLSELLLLYPDNFHWQPHDSKGTGKSDAEDQERVGVAEKWIDHATTNLPRYLATAHGVVSNVEKETPGEDQSKSTKKSPPPNRLMQVTAFGHELFRLDGATLNSAVRELQEQLLEDGGDVTKSFGGLATVLKRHLAKGLGETRWPLNDITLWDYAASVAFLFKSAVAKAVLEGRFVETSELRWRFLFIRYDGLEFLGRAHHISDLLGRRQALRAAQDAVRSLIEVELPLGNEVYRDENGAVLVVPHIDAGGEDLQVIKLAPGGGSDSASLREELQRRFSGAGESPLGAELVPSVILGPPSYGKRLRLSEPAVEGPSAQADANAVVQLWSALPLGAEVCTVCGVRAQGYGESLDDGRDRHVRDGHGPGDQPLVCRVCKAQGRSICQTCLGRRERRSELWATKPDEFRRTVWVDEVADDDGRLALIAGRFVLDDWLGGELIPTMMKGASFARVRRCWQTTRRFWDGIEAELPTLAGGYSRRRLVLSLDGVPNLGPHHAYELEINGRYLSVVWAPDARAVLDGGGGRLITTDNLDFAQKNLAVGELKDYLTGRRLSVYEPSAHLSHRQVRVEVTVREAAYVGDGDGMAYSPVISILSEPSIFLALVPADKALPTARRISEKYDVEMCRVRDRLPLHLGIVFAPRRTPVRALLDAGRRMLRMPDRWELWQVQTASAQDATGPQPSRHESVTFTNGLTWRVPAAVDETGAEGEGSPDDWYPHYLKKEPPVEVPGGVVHIRDLKVGDEVYVRPSRFDFEFLDTAGRRYEISYDGRGRRRGRPTRPFFLEHLRLFDEIWGALQHLETTRIHNLKGALTEQVVGWHGGKTAGALRDDAFRQFAADALHRLDRNWWNALSPPQQAAVERATSEGQLLDVLELMTSILKGPETTGAHDPA
jgi:hypothetical protein